MVIRISRISDFIPSPLMESIRKYFQEDESKKIYIFAPYIKTKILEKLLEEIPNEVTIITTWDTNDLISGSSDIELYHWCKNNGNHLYIHDHIHLKVYSINFESAIVGSGNVSKNGLMHDGNYEAAVFVELTKENRLYLEKIKNESRFVVDDIYQQYLENYEKCKKNAVKQEPFPQPEIISKEEYFLRSALPMTDSMEEVVQGYVKIQSDLLPSEDEQILDCIFHDILNYKIQHNLSEQQVREKLKRQFLEHPFTKKIMDEIDNHERKHFGMIKNWIRDHCTEVPLPRPWEFNENTKILMNWLADSGEYEKFKHGEWTESIRRVKNTVINNQGLKKYEKEILEILETRGKTINEIRKIYRDTGHRPLKDEPLDPSELKNIEEPVWHYKEELNDKIKKMVSEKNNKILNIKEEKRIEGDIAYVIPHLKRKSKVIFWYHKSGYYSDGVWRLTEKDKQEIQNREIINTKKTINIQNPILKFEVGKFYHHDDIWKPLSLGFGGGIRPSDKNNLVVVFMGAPDNPRKNNDGRDRRNIYEDSLVNGIYHYIGHGTGDQKLKSNNKSLANAKKDGRTIHLFHQHEINGKHEYVGEVELLAEPKTQIHNGDKQFVFLLRPIQILN